MWSKVMPFAVSVWVTSLLANLFELANRTMIVHYLPGTAEEAMALVGNYHASRVLPLLVVSVAALLSPMITPHLSHDWESGRRARVSMRLRLYLKLWALGTSAGDGRGAPGGAAVCSTWSSPASSPAGWPCCRGRSPTASGSGRR